MQTLTLLRAKLGYIFVATLFLSCFKLCLSQTLPTLTAISMTSNSGIPSAVYKFDRNISAFTSSSYTVTTTNAGNAPQTTASTLATISAANPNSAIVPLDLSSILTNDTAQIDLVLMDNSTPANVVRVASYSPDLSLLKSLKAFQVQVVGLQQDKQTLQTLLDTTKTQLSNVVHTLSSTALNDLGTELVGDTAIVLHFSTDIYSKVQITNTTINKTYPADSGTDHQIRIEGLSPQTTYAFQAIAFDAAGIAIPGLTRIVNVTTSNSVPLAPVMTVSAPDSSTLKVAVNFDPAQVFPANFKTYCALQYRLVIDEPSATYGQWQSTGDGQLNSLGIPQGSSFTASHDFLISGTSGKKYEVKLTVYDQNGHTFASPNPASATIPAQPPAFDFAGPIAVTLNTKTGISVAWKANEDIASASMNMVFPDGTGVNFPNSTQSISSSTVTISSGINSLISAVQAVQTKSAPPIITVMMKDKGGSLKTQSFTVTFVVAGAPAGAAPNVVAASTQLQQVAADPSKKIKWSDVLAAGLSVIVKAL